jgi:hypothetical protein
MAEKLKIAHLLQVFPAATEIRHDLLFKHLNTCWKRTGHESHDDQDLDQDDENNEVQQMKSNAGTECNGKQLSCHQTWCFILKNMQHHLNSPEEDTKNGSGRRYRQVYWSLKRSRATTERAANVTQHKNDVSHVG